MSIKYNGKRKTKSYTEVKSFKSGLNKLDNIEDL